MKVFNRPAGAARRRAVLAALAVLAGAAAMAACSPTVRVEAPEDPIEINLNVRIEQEVRVRVQRDLENLFEENEELF
jgi:hypothetical protein